MTKKKFWEIGTIPEQRLFSVTPLPEGWDVFITRTQKIIFSFPDWYNSIFALFGYNLAAFSLELTKGLVAMIGWGSVAWLQGYTSMLAYNLFTHQIRVQSLCMDATLGQTSLCK